MTPKERLEKLSVVLGEANKGLATSKEVADAIVPVLKELKAHKTSIKALLDKDNLKDRDTPVLRQQMRDISSAITNLEKDYKSQFSELGKTITRIKTQKGDKGDRGADGIGIKGDDGSPDTAEDIRNKLELLEGEERLSANAIDGVITQEGLDFAIGVLDKRTQYLINKATSASNSFITSLTTTGSSGAATVTNGVLNIPQYSGGGSSVVYNDVVSGVINGSNTIFTVPNVISYPITLFLSGSPYQAGIDYTYSNTTITMTTAPDTSLSGQPFWLAHT